MPATSVRSRRGRGIAVAIGLLVCIALLWGVVSWVKQALTVTPMPMSDQCLITDGSDSTSLTPDQTKYAALITGVATRRGLPPKAGVIALATALQESGLRNLDYGDRDSVGLFQQRPSQGWGTEAQLMDPYYASNAFYDALEKIDGWESGDVNDVAQEVQHSGVPDGYRRHVSRATLLGQTLAGVGGSVRCLDKTGLPGNPAAYIDLLDKTYGFSASAAGNTVSFDTRTEQGARALAYLAVANTHDLGVSGVTVGDQTVTTGTATPLPWRSATPGIGSTHVVVTFR